MIRSAASKVMWVGRATIFLAGLAVILALLFGVASMAFAGNGDPWQLGRNNTATNITRLAGMAGVDGPMVRITNNNDGTNDTALELVVQGGEPPMTVNSPTKVTNLNADEADGASFTFNRSGVIQPNASVDVLDVPNVGKLSAACGTGGDSFTFTYTNQFNNSQQQIADQRSQDGNEATSGGVLASGATKNYSFTSDGAANQGHRLFLQVAPSAQTSPTTQALATFHATALTQAAGQNTCRFQGTATVQ